MRQPRLVLAGTALFVASAGLLVPATAGAGPAAPTEPYTVTLKASAKKAVAKADKVTLSGRVTPRPDQSVPKSTVVVLQVRYENQKTWKREDTATVKKNGSFTFVVKPKTRLDRAYRVLKRGDAKAAAGKSPARNLDVVKWAWLADLVPSASESVLFSGGMPINGEVYAHTLYANKAVPSAFVEYTLGRHCEAFETTWGLSDRTETGGQGTIAATKDGVPFYQRTFNLGESETQSYDVTGVYRMRIDFAQVATTPPTEPSAGAARVLCD